MDTLLKHYLEHESLLFSIGYRMMGSAEDARDLLQETYLRFSRQNPSSIRNPRGLLVTILTRLAIDAKRSAYEKKRVYPGPWLPEPMVDGFEESVSLSESAGAAFLLLLERLAPVERAVVLLRDVFDYEYSEIGDIISRKPDHCRKIAERARKRVRQDRRSSRTGLSESKKKQLLYSFERACKKGELNMLLDLLCEDVQVHTDGGGEVVAAMRPIIGADHAARFFLGLSSKNDTLYSVPIRIGGQPAAIVFQNGNEINSVMQFRFGEDGIQEFYAVRNPRKLLTIRKRIRNSLSLRLKILFFRLLRHL